MTHLAIASALTLSVGVVALLFPPAAFGLGLMAMGGGLVARSN